ncbi:Gfo/Idh/MocA family oxidoreductase [Candidatus Pelagibacter sp.]|jgi:hypothetical protein|nr:Gfo/Idh/MocA family oxidoreductase [Candidatus Pelagibacter sp.]
MLNVVIIGCGNIGSRHFQSFSLLNEKSNIFLIDPSSEKINNAIKIYNTQKSKKLNSIERVHKIENINKKIDLLIIATTSSVRIDLIKKFFRNNKTKYVILEKFLFQKEEDYFLAEKIFTEHKARVWVNQPLCYQDCFKEIKHFFLKSKKIFLKISGGNWGLCCNSIHYIELFEYLTNRRKPLNLKSYSFEKIIESKRSDFYEIIGKLNFTSKCGSSIFFQTHEELTSKLPLIISIMDENNNSVDIECRRDSYKCSFSIDGKKFKKEFNEIYQSQLTEKIINEIIKKNYCSLPNYKTSMAQHLLLLNPFKEFFIKKNIYTSAGIPVT